MNQEILDYLTREQRKFLWGKGETGRDYLVEEIHGDGKQLVGLETMDSRPFHYYMRVDSSLDLSLEDDEILQGEDKECFYRLSEMIMYYIVEECDDIDRYLEIDGLYFDPNDETVEPFNYEMPMFSYGAGHCWWKVDLEKLEQEIKRERAK